MARRCELTGIGPQSGHNVSHSNRHAFKFQRTFAHSWRSICSRLPAKCHSFTFSFEPRKMKWA